MPTIGSRVCSFCGSLGEFTYNAGRVSICFFCARDAVRHLLEMDGTAEVLRTWLREREEDPDDRPAGKRGGK